MWFEAAIYLLQSAAKGYFQYLLLLLQKVRGFNVGTKASKGCFGLCGGQIDNFYVLFAWNVDQSQSLRANQLDLGCNL